MDGGRTNTVPPIGGCTTFCPFCFDELLSLITGSWGDSLDPVIVLSDTQSKTSTPRHSCVLSSERLVPVFRSKHARLLSACPSDVASVLDHLGSVQVVFLLYEVPSCRVGWHCFNNSNGKQTNLFKAWSGPGCDFELCPRK